MTLELAQDAGGGVGREANLSVRLEAPGRLDQSQVSDLIEVLGRFTVVGESPSERSGQPDVVANELLLPLMVSQGAGGRVSLAVSMTLPATRNSGRGQLPVQPAVTDAVLESGQLAVECGCIR